MDRCIQSQMKALGISKTIRVLGLVVMLAAQLALVNTPARAATIAPDTFVDEYGTGASCSLREAIQSINSGADFDGCTATGVYGTSDTINLATGTYLLSLASTGAGNNGGDLDITTNVTLNGFGGNLSGTIIDAQNLFRVIEVNNGPKNVIFNDIVFTRGLGNNTNYRGAGINVRNATLTINRSRISENVNSGSQGAGGIGVSGGSGNLTVNDSLIFGNTNASTIVGAGIDVNGGTLSITNSTFSGNIGTGPDLYTYSYGSGSATIAHVTMTDTINTANNFDGNYAAVFLNSILNDGCTREVTDNGYNRFAGTACVGTLAATSQENITPVVFPALALNGGTTGNHAIDNTTTLLYDQIPSGSNGCGTTYTKDQRGATRPDTVNNSNCDIGAFEYDPTFTQAVITAFRALTTSGGTVLEWETGSEVGTAGFYVKRRDRTKKRFVRVNDELVPSVGVPQGGTYRIIDPKAVSGESYRYKLVELEYSGKKNRYGPYEVTVDGEGYGREDPEGEKPPVPVGVTSSALEHRPSKAKRKHSHANHEARKAARKAKRKKHKGSALKLGVQEAGLYFVSTAEMATAFGVPEARVQRQLRRGRLKLKNRGETVAWHAAEDISGLYFYGEAIDSPFTRDNVYWIKRGKGLMMAEADGGAPAPVSGQSFLDEAVFEEDRIPATAITSDPDSDYWYWKRILAGLAGWETASFDLPVKGVADSNATLTIHLKGAGLAGFGKSFEVEVALNGIVVGGESWSGTEPVALEIPVTLQAGNNQVVVTGLNKAGADPAYILVDSIDVRYQRQYEAVAGELTLRGDGNDVVTVSGVDGILPRVLDISVPKTPVWLRNITADSTTTSFVPGAPERTYLVADSSAVKTPAWLVADVATRYRKRGVKAEYLVIAPTEWTEAAQALADLRTGSGLSTAVVALEDIYDEMSDGIATPHAIKDFLARMYRKGHGRLKYVVLLGEGSMDYRDLLGNGDSIVPPWMAGTPSGLFASDLGYGDVKGTVAPEIVVSRIPVESEQEIADYVAKLVAHEGSGLDKVVVLADVADIAGNFPADAEAIATMLPSGVPVDRIYVQDAPPYSSPYYSFADARTRLHAAFSEGVGLINYSGHAGIRVMGSTGLLRDSDIAGLGNAGQYPVLLALTCVLNRFDLAGFDSLGEQLVLSPVAGAVAVLAPSGLSIDSAAQLLNQALMRAIYGHGDAILGDVILRALDEYVDSGQTPYMAAIYNLLGDPYVRLNITQTDPTLKSADASSDRKRSRKRERKRARQNRLKNHHQNRIERQRQNRVESRRESGIRVLPDD
ncbi:peptidase family C25 [bacterium BMS3Abin11]|nr:peptidase family C25 [bacterium BMS3Abin11]